MDASVVHQDDQNGQIRRNLKINEHLIILIKELNEFNKQLKNYSIDLT